MGDVMRFNFPGGAQPLSVNPMSQLPQTPLSNATPGQFPHQSPGVGTGLGYPGSAPGTGIAPGRMPGTGTAVNKGTFPSNELVSQPLVPKNWNSSVAYEKFQQPGDILFVRREQDSHVSSAATLNLSQMNEHLREGFKHLQSQRTAKAKTSFTFQGTPVRDMDKPVLDALDLYRKDGEMALVEDPKLKKEIATDRSMKALMFISKEHIIEAYNFIGIYMSNDGTEHKVNRSINVGVSGPTHYQEVTNVWGEFKDEQKAFLILTRRQLTSGATPTYGEFMLLPYVCYEKYPPPYVGVYYDDAGIRHEPFVIYVGRAYYRPTKWNEDLVCKKLAGLTVTSNEAAEQAKLAHRVALVLGIPKHSFDIYPC